MKKTLYDLYLEAHSGGDPLARYPHEEDDRWMLEHPKDPDHTWQMPCPADVEDAGTFGGKNAMTDSDVFEIHEDNLERLEKHVAKLAAKARAWGLPEPTIEVVSRGTRGGPREGQVQPVVYVRVTGEAPKLSGGWRFAGVIDVDTHSEKMGYLITQSPFADDLEIPERFRTEEPTCEHCGLVRNRRKLLLLVNEQGEWKRVGGDCARDFLGHVDPQQLADWLYDVQSTIEGLRDDESWQMGNHNLDIRWYLARVAAAIREYGWVSRSYARDNWVAATADLALPTPGHPDDLKVTDEDREQADAALHWARTELQKIASHSEYLTNLAIICEHNHITYKHAGLAASLIITWKKHNGIQEGEKAVSQHQGEVGERIERELTVDRVLVYEGYMGRPYCINVMHDPQGNVYIWKTSRELQEGATYRILGTVKDHDEYRGVPQTVLARCKALELIETERSNNG